MAVLKNKTQKNFTMISNHVLRDKELSMKDRGVFCTLCSLPDGWEFSIAGLSAIVPDGVDAIRASVVNLEDLGYMERTKSRGKDGKYISEIEVFTEKRTMRDYPSRLNRDGLSNTAEPSRVNRHGRTVTDNPTQYNTDNIKKKYKTDDTKSINQSIHNNEIDGQTDMDNYHKLVAENIRLECLLEIAGQNGADEVNMVNEIYDVICDIVCYERKEVIIKDVKYPWEVVKSQFLKLRYEHIADVLNRVVDAELGIKNMSAYLVSTLYTASLVGTIEAQANMHGDYLKFLRGKPY
ncbi:MAG: helix-turn-helix domain-containing protein [Lachnospiraceae bacterium]|nr:helix-turn-helix domain-containing protein [Lachnospiraceae bacterium]